MNKEIEIKVAGLNGSLNSDLSTNSNYVLLYGELYSESSIEINELKSEINDFCDEQ